MILVAVFLLLTTITTPIAQAATTPPRRHHAVRFTNSCSLCGVAVMSRSPEAFCSRCTEISSRCLTPIDQLKCYQCKDNLMNLYQCSECWLTVCCACIYDTMTCPSCHQTVHPVGSDLSPLRRDSYRPRGSSAPEVRR